MNSNLPTENLLECVCGSTKIKWKKQYQTKWGLVDIGKCHDCGLVRDLIKHDSNSFYTDSVNIYKPLDDSEFQSQVSGMRRYVSFLEKHIHLKGKVLDVGCNAGYLVHALSEAGWKSSGVELVPSVAKSAVSRGLKVFNCKIDELPHEESLFDLITTTHVLEHISNPSEFLRSIFNHLNPNGYLFIAVPNFSKIATLVYRERWNNFLPGQHIWYFERQTLCNLCKTTGFELLQDEVSINMQVESQKMFGSLIKKFLILGMQLTGDGEELIALFKKS
jgi:2-polyprenyl-3-methyl-5-hydroxy-6-metoxy-1,4-benzoquinol methylase